MLNIIGFSLISAGLALGIGFAYGYAHGIKTAWME